jgi:hypothetical protein
VFGCCGFLSFSLVFCLLGGRLETTLYIHFIRRWVKSRRHSSAPRKSGRKKKGRKERHSSQCRTPGSRLEKGRVLKEGWPEYYVGLKDGTLVVRFGSTDSDGIERTAP